MTSVDEIQKLRIDPGLIPGLVSMQILAIVQGSGNTSPKIPGKILSLVTNRYLKRVYQSLDAIRDTVLDAIRDTQPHWWRVDTKSGQSSSSIKVVAGTEAGALAKAQQAHNSKGPWSDVRNLKARMLGPYEKNI
jgi:hypothetical protein